MSGTTISSYTTTGINLSNPSQNPLTVTGTGEVKTSRSDAITSQEYHSTWTIDNYGTISSNSFGTLEGQSYGTGFAITLAGSGYITNGALTDQAALIYGSETGIFANHGSVLNFGTVMGSGDRGDGVVLNNVLGTLGNAVTNGAETDKTALIQGNFGIALAASASVSSAVTNFGTVIGTESQSLVLQDGTILNGSPTDTTALISGRIAGALITGKGEIKNYGTIQSLLMSPGSSEAAGMLGDGTIINYGLIRGNQAVAVYGSNNTIINAGTIIGGPSSNVAIDFEYNSLAQRDRLIIDPGAVFVGDVLGLTNTSNSTAIELASSSSAGIISGIGTQFTNFETIDIDTGASWLITGDSLGLAHNQTITGFTSSDTIVLDGFTATSHTYVSSTGLELSDGTITETLNITGTFDPNSFTISTDPQGTEITVCYLRGTRILTPTGETPIEALQIGDPVVNRFNGVQPIKWIGRQSFARRFIKNNREQLPVRISAGALGEGLPARDLFVSPGHSMLLQDTLILAKSLVNGITITQDSAPEEIHYYQVELETHDCIAAEGSWAETYADCPGLRAKFHNAATFEKLYPDYQTPGTLYLCAPRPLSGRLLDVTLRPVLARATENRTPGNLRGWVDRIDREDTIHGWAQDEQNPELPVLLEVLLDGAIIQTILACDYRGDLAAAGLGSGQCGFALETPADITPDFINRLLFRRAADGAPLAFSHQLRATFAVAA